MPTEPLVIAFHNERVFSFERADMRTPSSFGGPMLPEVSGLKYGPKPLHMIARLGGLNLDALSEHRLTEIPLIYGMNYDGCELRYRVEYGHKIELLYLSPMQSSEDWPYANFPLLLPYVPLRLCDVPERMSYSTWAEALPNPNLPEAQPAELVVVVPPPAGIGVSLWGYADGDDVMIVFECDLKSKTVKAYNAAT